MESTNRENTLCKRDIMEVYAECAAEYILPDYKGDIKRILHTEARVIPAGSFGEGRETEFCGNLVFCVIYLDSENKLTSVEFTSDYSLKAPCAEGVSAVFASESAENANIRLPGPRKMLARCTVKGEILTARETECTPTGSSFEEANISEVSRCTLKSGIILRGKSGGREYAEDFFFIPGGTLDDTELIAKRATVKINSVSAKENGVGVSGEIAVLGIVKNGESAPFIKEMKIPFDEDVEVLGAYPEADALANGEIVSLECSLSPTEDGVRAVINLILEIEASVYSNKNTELLTDAYSLVGEVENKYETVDYEEFIGARRESTRLSLQIPKESTDAPAASDIVYLSAEIKTNSIKCEPSGVLIEGEVRFSGVACEIYEDGGPAYTSFKFSIPFSENVNFNTQIPKDARIEAGVLGFEPKITLDENNFYAECGICMSVGIFAPRQTVVLTSSDVISEAKERRAANVISVYYPEEGDTLFGVAKRFKTSPTKIAEDNALTAEAVSAKNAPASLSAVTKLIIKNA